MSVRTVDDLATHSAATLAELPNAGRLTVVELVAALIEASVDGEPDQSGQLAPPGPAQVSETSLASAAEGATGVPEAEIGPVRARLLGDLAVVARWRHLWGDPSSPLLQGAVDESAPSEVQEAQERLAALCAADLLSAESKPDPVGELQAALAGFTERELEVLGRRLFAQRPETLDAIGRDRGVTRERVRQVEARLRTLLADHTTFGTAAGDLLAVVRAEIRPVASLRRLVEHHPVLESLVPAVGIPLWLALDRLDDAFVVQDGWAAAPTIDAAVERTRRLLEDLDDRHGLVPLTAAADRLGESLTAQEVQEWLRYCGYELREGHVLTRTRSIPDRAAAVLALAGQPLALSEITDRLGVDRNAGSCRNALNVDVRFTRVGRDQWALMEWGLEGYTSIRDAIGREIDAGGGAVKLDGLTAGLVRRYSVAPSSVTAYASAEPYEVRGGVVRRRTHIVLPRKDPRDTRRLFRHGDTWRYRLVVNRDHLRGSGFPVPTGVAALVGCPPRGTVSLDSRLGPQPVRWMGLQPSVGTIRRFLEALQAGEGMTVFLCFGDDHRFDVQPGVDPRAVSDPLVKALVLVGVTDPAQQEDPLRALAGAVCLPSDTDAVAVLGAYRDRGEQDVAELLVATRDRLHGTVTPTSEQNRRTPPDQSRGRG